MMLLALLTMLPSHSVEVITNLSTPPINESSNLEDSSGEEMVDIVRKQKVSELDKIVDLTLTSKKDVDTKLAALIRQGKTAL